MINNSLQILLQISEVLQMKCMKLKRKSVLFSTQLLSQMGIHEEINLAVGLFSSTQEIVSCCLLILFLVNGSFWFYFAIIGFSHMPFLLHSIFICAAVGSVTLIHIVCNYMYKLNESSKNILHFWKYLLIVHDDMCKIDRRNEAFLIKVQRKIEYSTEKYLRRKLSCKKPIVLFAGIGNWRVLELNRAVKIDLYQAIVDHTINMLLCIPNSFFDNVDFSL